jgi:tetratricopeptide (TPR) repeat protein
MPMSSSIRIVTALLNALLLASSLDSSESRASLIEAPQAHEVALLPEYCRHAQLFVDKFGNRKEEQEWIARMGRKNFQSIHHYCWAMVAIMRANRGGVSANLQNHNLQSAVADIDYVIRATSEDFVLLPELWTRRGKVLLRLKQYPNAEESFRQAAKMRPDYWPAYTGLAQLFLDQGKKADAMEALKVGLKYANDRRALERMLREIR